MKPTLPQKIPGRAWGIVVLASLALLLFILDRQVLAILKTTLKRQMGWSDVDYSWIATGFSVAYTVGALGLGRFIDRAGTRLAAVLSIGVMSLSAILCGTARNFSEMLIARMVLGFAEAGVTLAAVVAVARWFPAERRATAISLKTPIGLMGFVIAPPLVALITLHHDWHYAFFIPGGVGLVLPMIWWWLDRDPPNYGVTHGPPRSMPWRELFRYRALWGILLARVIAEPVYIFYANWEPGYLQDGLGLTLADVGRYAWIPPVASSALCVLGGLASDGLIKRGMNPSHSRTALMQALALLGASLWLLPFSRNWALAIGVFACIHMIWSQWNNLSTTLIADTLPRGFTGTAFGLLNFLIGIVGAVVKLAIGALLQAFGYNTIIAMLGFLYPLAAVVLWWFYGRAGNPSQESPPVASVFGEPR